MQFAIKPLNEEIAEAIQDKIDQKTKPLGALGMLEKVALKVAQIQETTTPHLYRPVILVFAGDHGIAAKGEVNPFPQEVTAQMVYNFTRGGAAINVFCLQNEIELKVIDAGVNHHFTSTSGVIHAKIALGTKNYETEPAMSKEQCESALNKGADLVHKTFVNGSNIIGFGEMGIANTSSAALLMSAFTKQPLSNCVGSGTGLEPTGVQRKIKILEKVQAKYEPNSPEEVLATFGGFEIAMITGGILKAASLGMTILIDGFIVTAALLTAQAINPEVVSYCIFAHVSDEKGHQKMLEFLNVQPMLHLGLRLGEGTGAALAVPLVQASVNFLNDMASFEAAKVSTKKS